MKTPTEARINAVCPICGETYNAPPALSRADGKSLICPDCGIREALSSIGVAPEEQEKILETIHEHTRGKHQHHSCKYCGNITDGENDDVLCKECRELFGHTFFSEL